jgi:enamine deaminase RidA (YjgF/YER057c/UK114 family)
MKQTWKKHGAVFSTFVADLDEFQKCADIRMRYLGVATPTNTTVGVTRLAGPDFMIEIEAVAIVKSLTNDGVI